MTRARGWTRTWTAAALAMLGASLACHDDDGITAVSPVAAVSLAPLSTTLYPAQTVQLAAMLRDASGDPVDRHLDWTSDHPGVATVDAAGLVTAISAGTTAIMATAEGITGAATVTVLAPVQAVLLTPSAATLLTAETVQLSATLFDAMGAELVRPITWTSDAPAVASVDAHGLVTGLTPGVAVITSASEGLMATATITVQAPIASVTVEPMAPVTHIGQTLRLTARVRDADGNELQRTVRWASRRPGVATVDATGLVTALAPGSTTITATGAGVVGAANVTVLTPIAKIELSETSAEIETEDTVQLTAVARDAQGSTLIRPLVWTSDSPDVATVSEGGLVTGVGAGVAHITATGEGISAIFQVTVLARAATMTIAPATASAEVGDVVTLVVTALDAHGNPVDRTVAWSSSQAACATVDHYGVVTAVGGGTAVITATIGATTATATITVTVTVAQVSLSAPVTTLDVSTTTQLTAVPLDRNGRGMNQPLQWTTSNPGVATVTPNGLVTGIAPGTATISASAGGQVSSVTITVRTGVDRVLVTASATTLTPEAPTAQLTASVLDAGSNPLQTPVTWTSNAPAVMTVTPTGLQTADVTLVGTGSATITATAGGKSGSVTMQGTGSPGGMEETANNLSWPAIFVDGLDISGAPVGTDAGLRPTTDEGITADTLPFWYHLNTFDWLGTYYLQGGTNTWRAEWLDGGGANYSAEVAWGDNLTHHGYDTHTMIHIEVSLTAIGVPAMRGFNMFVLAGSGPDEIQGTDGTVGTFSPMLFTVHPRLLIEKVDAQGGNPLFPVVDVSVAAGFGGDGPGLYGGELNKAGKIVYGYNLRIKDLTTIPSDQQKYGWYRLNFILEDQVTVGGVTLQRHVSLDGLAAGDDSEAPLYVPQIDSDGRRSYLDIYIKSASGGHGGE